MNVKSLSLFAVSATCLLNVGRSQAKATPITESVYSSGSVTVSQYDLGHGAAYSGWEVNPVLGDGGELLGLPDDPFNGLFTSVPAVDSLLDYTFSFGSYSLRLGQVTSVGLSYNPITPGSSLNIYAKANLFKDDLLVSSGVWIFDTQTDFSGDIPVEGIATTWSADYSATPMPDTGTSAMLLGVGLLSLMVIRKTLCCD